MIMIIIVTAIIIIIGTPVLASALAMLFMDNFLHTSFFEPANLVVATRDMSRTSGGGQPLLWQHLFWVFGHPEVYILILPAMGVISEILPTFARKPLFGYPIVVFSGAVIGFLGFEL